MSLPCRLSWLVAWVLVLAAATPALAGGHLSPMETNGTAYIPPKYEGGLDAFDWFGPAEPCPYGGERAPNEGFFGVYDLLHWSVGSPEGTYIGLTDARNRPVGRQVFISPLDSFIQVSTYNTRFLESEFTSGGRLDLGYICDQHGWFFSGYSLSEQGQRLAASDVHVVFQDQPARVNPGQEIITLPSGVTTAPNGFLDGFLGFIGTVPVFGPLPVTFQEMEIFNEVNTWNVEANYLFRTEPTHTWGYFEFFGGARYMQFDERFIIDAQAPPLLLDETTELIRPPLYEVLSDWTMKTDAENHMVGPQVGMRWFNQKGRWKFDVEGRAFSAINFQNIDQHGTINADYFQEAPGHIFAPDTDPFWFGPLGPGPIAIGQPYVMGPTGFYNTRHFTEWSPSGELRMNLTCQLTRSISIGGGWTGTYLTGIARSVNMVRYRLPEMGIIAENNRQDVFLNGWNFRIELNR